MTEDPRTGKAESGSVEITDSDGNTPQTAFQIPSNTLYRVERVKVEYDDGGTNAGVDVGLFDDADGTSAGNVSDERDRFLNIDPDTLNEFEGPWRVFEEDVLVQSIGDNHDGDVRVTVYGTVLSDLQDMVAFA